MSVAAGVWFLGKTEDDRLGRRTHWRDMGRVDGSPWLCALWRARGRLGLSGDDFTRRARRQALRGHSHHARIQRRAEVEGEPTAEEKRALAGLKHYVDLDSGYSKEQSTRPQTLGYGLTDSPAGQAAWILEKFWAWTDCNGHPENIFSKDELLDNVMLYWVTASATSSARLYWESFGKRRTTPVVNVPTGVAVFPKEIITPVRRWMEPNFTNITHWSEMEKGGHFAAFEQPELFVREVRAFFRTLR